MKASTERGRSRWIGPGVPLSFDLCRAIRRILVEASLPIDTSRRARTKLDELRRDFSWVDDRGTVIVRDPAGTSHWWTFAGLRSNTVLGELAGPLRLPASRERNLSIRLRDGVNPEELRARLRDGPADAVESLFPVSDDAVDSLKFSGCLPGELAARTLGTRGSDTRSVQTCLREPIRHVTLPPNP